LKFKFFYTVATELYDKTVKCNKIRISPSAKTIMNRTEEV